MTGTYFSARYDSAAHEVIALLADEAEGYGRRDDTTGTVDAPGGYIALVTIPADVAFETMVSSHAKYLYNADSVASEHGVQPADVIGSHIVTHTDQGFVYVETFATETEAREQFDCRAARFAAWVGHEDECATVCQHDSGSPLWDSGCDWDGVYICPVSGHGYHTV